MRIPTQAEYGLICALHLARRIDEGPVTGREIAARERLPADYVEQIMLKLRRAEIVKSTRGAHGGYRLARPAEEIAMDEVVLALEGSIAPMECFTSVPPGRVACSHAPSCTFRIAARA